MKRLGRIAAFVALALVGCADKGTVAALPVDDAAEMKTLMADCRDTYAAADAYAKKHDGYPDQDQTKEALQPFLKPGSHADLARFVQAFPGGRAAVRSFVNRDGPIKEFPEFGHYKGQTGTASVTINGDVKWTPNEPMGG